MDDSASSTHHNRMPKHSVSEDERKFGLIVRRLREKSGFSQENFADHIGIDRSYQGQIERGEASVTLHKITLIAKGLSLPRWQLLKYMEESE